MGAVETVESRIEQGATKGRLSLAGVDLHAGDTIEVLVLGAWVPARVEFDASFGWLGYVAESRQDGEASLVVLVRPRLRARWPKGR